MRLCDNITDYSPLKNCLSLQLLHLYDRNKLKEFSPALYLVYLHYRYNFNIHDRITIWFNPLPAAYKIFTSGTLKKTAVLGASILFGILGRAYLGSESF